MEFKEIILLGLIALCGFGQIEHGELNDYILHMYISYF